MSKFSDLMTKIAHVGYLSSQRIRFYRKLATLMKNGKQLQASVADLKKRAERRAKTDIEAIALNEILGNLRSGMGFGYSIQNFTSVNERMILESGEVSGDLPGALELAADVLEASAKMKSKVVSAIASPLFLIAMLIVVIVMLAKFALPQLASVLSPENWEPAARTLYTFTQWVNSPWFFLMLGILLFVLIVVGLSLPLWSKHGRKYFEKIPPWSIFRLLIGSAWILSLASLVKSGQTVLKSLTQMRDISKKNKWLYERLNRTIFFYNSGLNLGEALEATGFGFPDQEIVDDLVTYSEMPGFDNTLHSLGKEWVDKGVEKISKQASVLNLSAVALVGLVIGWFAYAVISIQMSLGTHFSGM